MRQRQRAFTLIEMLTVVTVIAILAALIFPLASRMTMTARKSQNISDLRQVYLAIISYTTDHDGLLPGPCYTSVTAEYKHNDRSLSRLLVPYLISVKASETKPGEDGIVPQLLPAQYKAHFPNATISRPYNLNALNYTDEDYQYPFGYPPPTVRQPKKFVTVPDQANNELLYGLDMKNVNGNPGWAGQLTPGPLYGSTRLYLMWDGHVEDRYVADTE